MKRKMKAKAQSCCEHCGIIMPGYQPEGWVGFGTSAKYGTQYDPDGIALWCPHCKHWIDPPPKH